MPDATSVSALELARALFGVMGIFLAFGSLRIAGRSYNDVEKLEPSNPRQAADRARRLVRYGASKRRCEAFMVLEIALTIVAYMALQTPEAPGNPSLLALSSNAGQTLTAIGLCWLSWLERIDIRAIYLIETVQTGKRDPQLFNMWEDSVESTQEPITPLEILPVQRRRPTRKRPIQEPQEPEDDSDLDPG